MKPDYVTVNRHFYDENAETYANMTAGMSDHEWLQKFSSNVRPHGRILDVGCAAGRDSAWFSARGFDVVGIDISRSLISIASKAVPHGEFHVMNLTELTFPSSSFDGIWCSCVLLHVPHAEARSAVVGLADRLRPDGVIYVLVKAGTGEGLEKDPRYNNAIKFSSYFEVQEIFDILLDAGLKVISISDLYKRVDDYRARERIFALARKPSL